jgi:aminoglycoside 6'-N-acetyltransferase I
MIHIRPVTPADASRWNEMRAALWPDELPADLATDVDSFFAGTCVQLEAVLVAEDAAHELIGFAELSRRLYAEGCITSPVGFLEGWYVVPEHRGRGVGRALVAAAEEWARGCGCTEFASDTTVDNTASAAAHQALGFEEVEIIRCFRKDLTVTDC